MSQLTYENSAYAECRNDRSLEKPKVNTRKSITRYVILFSILIAVCLVVSISALIFAVKLSLQSEDTRSPTQATYLENGTEPTIEHLQGQLKELEIKIKELDSVNSKLSFFLTNTQDAVKKNAEQQQQFQVFLKDQLQSLNDTIDSHHKVQGL